MKSIYVLAFISTLFLLTSCSAKTEYIVQKETEYPRIPKRLQNPRQVPLKVSEPVTIGEALRQGREMRGEFCVLYAEYIELLRNSSFGEIVLDRATEDRCPSDLID